MLKTFLAALMIVGALGRGDGVSAAEPPSEAAQVALTAFTEAVASGDSVVVAEVLAPEFQILRANGVGYDRAGYLASDLPAIDPSSAWSHEDVVATAEGDILVVRYQLVIDETIDGEPVTRRAPRLTVFRRDGDAWLVVAHANFVTPE